MITKEITFFDNAMRLILYDQIFIFSKYIFISFLINKCILLCRIWNCDDAFSHLSSYKTGLDLETKNILLSLENLSENFKLDKSFLETLKKKIGLLKFQKDSLSFEEKKIQKWFKTIVSNFNELHEDEKTDYDIPILEEYLQYNERMSSNYKIKSLVSIGKGNFLVIFIFFYENLRNFDFGKQSRN